MLTDLFTIESVTEENPCAFLAKASVDANHPVFQGHFPGIPVLPGVCSLYLIRTCAERFLGCCMRYNTVDFCKFTAMIDPLRNEQITVKGNIKQDEEEIQIKAMMLYGNRTVLKLQATVREITL